MAGERNSPAICYTTIMQVQIEKSWKRILKDEFDKDYFITLSTRIRDVYHSDKTVYPPPQLVFNAFSYCPFDTVKVVILGQDPYINPEEAQGLSFSVPDGIRIPPSLRNIYKEIQDDLGTAMPESGNLVRWAEQGVLLLNSTLTVEAHQSASHRGWGWEEFTDAVIKKISQEKEHIVFMLWGNYARSKCEFINTSKHLILEAPHPSPLSAHNGFFGSRHFSQCNNYLKTHNLEPIAW